jgi:MerR family copper efflux transcriptional regulator
VPRAIEVAGDEAVAQLRLMTPDAPIAELQRMRDGLAQLAECYSGHGEPDHCPILQALTHEEMSS